MEVHYEPKGGPSDDKPSEESDRSGYEITKGETVHRELSEAHEECGKEVHQFDSLANGVRVTG